MAADSAATERHPIKKRAREVPRVEIACARILHISPKNKIILLKDFLKIAIRLIFVNRILRFLRQGLSLSVVTEYKIRCLVFRVKRPSVNRKASRQR